MGTEQDLFFMQAALTMARQGKQQDEVPVGAIVVRQGKIIAQAYNAPIAMHDPSAHAEIRALRTAAQVLKNYRLIDCELYVTLEPCVMCAGAIIHARVQRLIYAASDFKTGACGSVVNLFSEPKLNHHATVTGGVMAEESLQLLKEFFAEKRARAKQQKATLLSLGRPTL